MRSIPDLHHAPRGQLGCAVTRLAHHASAAAIQGTIGMRRGREWGRDWGFDVSRKSGHDAEHGLALLLVPLQIVRERSM